MKKSLIKSKENDSKKENLKDFKEEFSKEEFRIKLKEKAIESYNIQASKKDMKNSLSPEEIYNIDKDFIPQIMPKEAKLAQYEYSVDSTLFNAYFRGISDKLKTTMEKSGISAKVIEKGIDDLKKSIVVTKKDYIVYRGIEGEFDLKRFNDSGGFISTSFDKAISKGYTRGKGEVIAIKVSKGTFVMYIRHNSVYPHHMELLIPENYKLKELVRKGKKEYIVIKRNNKK